MKKSSLWEMYSGLWKSLVKAMPCTHSFNFTTVLPSRSSTSTTQDIMVFSFYQSKVTVYSQIGWTNSTKSSHFIPPYHSHASNYKDTPSTEHCGPRSTLYLHPTIDFIFKFDSPCLLVSFNSYSTKTHTQRPRSCMHQSGCRRTPLSQGL